MKNLTKPIVCCVSLKEILLYILDKHPFVLLWWTAFRICKHCVVGYPDKNKILKLLNMYKKATQHNPYTERLKQLLLPTLK